MTTEEYRNDMLYHAALSIGKTMLEKGLINEEEYAEMDTVLLQNTNHIWGFYSRIMLAMYLLQRHR